MNAPHVTHVVVAGVYERWVAKMNTRRGHIATEAAMSWMVSFPMPVAAGGGHHDDVMNAASTSLTLDALQEVLREM